VLLEAFVWGAFSLWSLAFILACGVRRGEIIAGSETEISRT
jgi:hypothetical protein